jgi:putative PIN family toxin of toxin-antitoxin system
MIRAVLDANVLVSALLNPESPPATVLTAWRSEQFQLVLSEAILEEIARVLRYPKIAKRHGWHERQVRRFLEDVAYLAILTPGHLRLNVIREDPPDDRYLECAIESAAHYIVSGDAHLLLLGTYEGIRILAPRTFLEVLSQEEVE